MDVKHKLTKLSFKNYPMCFSSLILSSGGTRTLGDKIKLEKQRGSQQQDEETSKDKHTNSRSKNTQNKPKCTVSAQESPLKGRYYCCHCHNLFENLLFRDRQFTLVSAQKVIDLMTHGEKLKIEKEN